MCMKGDYFLLIAVLWMFFSHPLVAQESVSPISDTVSRSIPEVLITGLQTRKNMLQRIETRSFNRLPNPSGNIETLLKLLPGVSSNNELSAQYSVRGGSFDENLVYVNDVEIYRPVLIRSGQQEGLSFINPDLVSSVDFSAGGFDARYGDKMSSVLDVQYRVPSEFAVNTSVSLLGVSVAAEDQIINRRFSYLVGARYKTSQYLLGTLDTQGDYAPDFFDVQSLLRYRIAAKWDADLLVNISRNRYRFEPTVRTTNFGTLYESYQLDVFYDGKEIDRYNSGMGALTLTHRPSDKWMLKLTGVAYQSEEQETFDIESAYRLNDLENNTFSDSVVHVGTGSELNHARNFLKANNYSFSHTGAFHGNKQSLQWSATFQREVTDNRLNEWIMLDSAGYSIPHNEGDILLKMSRHADNYLKVHRLISWLQFQQKLTGNYANWAVTAGLRLNYNDVNKECLLSPRLSATIRPHNSGNLEGHVAIGMYGQPPAYRELRDAQGLMNTDIKAQRSTHYTIGGDYVFHIGYRPFKLSSDLYYKQLRRLIPYRMENVRIYYAGDNLASGYITGWDIKLNGEFVKDAESWISLSLMRAREKMNGDAHSFPFPTDQWANFNLFFQDYFPTSPDWRVFLNLSLGSPLPYHYPNQERFDQTFRMTAYRRVDIGLTKDFFKARKSKIFKQLSLNAEIFNLFNTKNTISYFWMQVVNNQDGHSQQYAIPNYLTARRFNVKLSASF